MATNRVNMHSERPIAAVLSDFKEEMKEFLSTRMQMLRAEMREKTQAWKVAAPAIVIGAVMLGVAFLLFTGLLVAVIIAAFPNNPWGPTMAFAVVFVLYALSGAVALMYGIRTLKASGVAPERTLRVLKEDQVWLQTEARTQL